MVLVVLAVLGVLLALGGVVVLVVPQQLRKDA